MNNESNHTKDNTLETLVNDIFTTDSLVRMIINNPKKKSSPIRKIILRPIELRGHLLYQCEYHFLKKVTHENLNPEECPDFVMGQLQSGFRQMDLFTTKETIQVLASKTDRPRIIKKSQEHAMPVLAHNRIKLRPLPEGVPCDFLVYLGIMDKEGNVFKTHYGKYRQINRYLEIISDIKNDLPKDKTLRIIDFGCDKAYLTFALYYYLHHICNMSVDIIGLDLKQDVIDFCNETAEKLHYEHLHFRAGDIATFQGEKADMVVSLHACDTATDFALINAAKWKTKVILSVPCCQHELFSQIHHDTLDPMLRHGIIRDRFTEILTDGLRASKLESVGYDVSMIEFTSLEHTARNILIRAVRPKKLNRQKMKKAEEQYTALCRDFHVSPTIDQL